MSSIEDVDEALDDPNDQKDGDGRLAAKYRDIKRQIFPQKIELPISALTTMAANQIDLAPDFQRRDVWPREKQSKFIESLLMNVPVPPVFMGEDSYGKYVVLDGRQRLTAILKFLSNEYALKGLTVWKELNNDRFLDLKDKQLDAGLTRRFIPAVVLLKESSPEIKYDVFERLNTGGLNLNSMEIRNAIYRGEFTKLIHDCSANRSFRTLWGIPTTKKDREKNNLFSRMRDLELVLRFFALSSAQENPSKRSAFKTYLGSYMSARNEEYLRDDSLREDDKNLFDRAISNCQKILGDNAFNGPKESRNAPLADALMFALKEVDPSVAADSQLRSRICNAIKDLLVNPDFLATMDQGTNGRAKIEKRLNMAKNAVYSCLPDNGA